ncbi:MAG: hypothetical protein ABFD80_07420 [Acidobacteriota bacterium]
MDPVFMAMTDGKLYIADYPVSVHSYAVGPEGLTFIKSFSRPGQGPGEFNIIFRMRVFGDHMDIAGSKKLARFSLDGKYLDEVTFPISVIKGWILRLGEDYVARDIQITDVETTSAIRLYDKNFKLIKELGTAKVGYGFEKINLAGDYYSQRVVDDRIYVAHSGKDTVIAVFDRDGIKKKEILLPLEPVKMTAALKDILSQPMRDDQESKARWKETEKLLYFPDFTPGLDYFDVVEGKFVARTYHHTQDAVEFVIFDQQGRESRRLNLPFTGAVNNSVHFCFYQGSY